MELKKKKFFSFWSPLMVFAIYSHPSKSESFIPLAVFLIIYLNLCCVLVAEKSDWSAA